jgi:hypothetical protein
LQGLGNIIIIYLFTHFIYRKKIVAFFTQVPLFVVDDAAFNNVVILAFWTA